MINFEKHTWYNKNDSENASKRIPLSAHHLNRIENGIEGAYTFANELTAPIPAIAPYLTFVGNANANMIAAAFGKGNETENIAIGKALKMYANFCGETDNLDFLDEYNNYKELVKAHKYRLVSNSYINTLIASSSYASGLLKSTIVGMPDIVLYESGKTDYLNLSGATIVCEKSIYDIGNYTSSMDFAGDVLNVKAVSKMSPSGDEVTGRLAARCTIPLSKPLPKLCGYGCLNIKFADDAISGFTHLQSPERTYANIVVAGNTLNIPCSEEDLSLKGEVKTQDFFDSYIKNPVKDNIEIQLNLERITSEQTVEVNIEKIWISEA